MRVVYFSQDYTPHDHRFLAALAGTEHEVHHLRLEATEPVKERRPLPEGIRSVEWWGGRRPVRGLGRLRAVKEVGRVLTELEPDLVHAGPVQSTAALAAAAGAEPLVTMSWGSDLLRGADSLWGGWVARWTLGRSEAFVCDCQTVRRRGLDLGADPDATFVFPWGVDLDRFQPGQNPKLREQEGWSQDHIVLLSTRAWEPLLGIRELVEGFILAADEEPRLRLMMLGDGGLRGWVLRRLDRADMLERVALPGQISNEELPAHYQAADIYLTASRSDGSSVSLMEALASGVPALVSDIPGNREWILPGENGWWFPVGEARGLKEVLLGALRERDRWDEMGTAARRAAEAKADWSRNFPVLLEAYRHAARSADGV